jgi:polyisoprenoid-binding protein YceI
MTGVGTGEVDGRTVHAHGTGDRPSRPRRRRRRWLIGGGIAIVVVILAGLISRRALVGGPAPDPFALPPASADAQTTSGASDPTGTWRVDDGSTAGYRVDQIVVGTRSTITARTDRVSGSMTIAGSSVTSAAFRVELTDLATNDSQREAFGAADQPRAELQLTEPIEIGELPALSATTDHPATGDLSFHGVTRSVTFTVSARRTPGRSTCWPPSP